MKRLVLVFGCAVALLGSAAPAWAVEEGHLFDPALSLTGGCGTSGLDKVPDPGCPEENHKPGNIVHPKAVVTDFYGNIYVSSGLESETATKNTGRIDIFGPSGKFITEVVTPREVGGLAVDSKGNLYAVVNPVGSGFAELRRYPPSAPYEPEAGDIAYGSGSVLVGNVYSDSAVALNVSNDRLFVHKGNHIGEYASAEEGNALLDDSIGKGILLENFRDIGLAVDAKNERIYALEAGSIRPPAVRVLSLAAPHELLMTIGAGAFPGGKLNGEFALAVDEGSGNFFVYEGEFKRAVHELTKDGAYVRSIEHGFVRSNDQLVGVDNGPFSPNGALNPAGGRYLFVASHQSGTGHVFAFEPEPLTCPPEVTSPSAVEVTQDEAELRGVVNPCGAATSYQIQYTTEQSFENEGFDAAQTVGEGSLPVGDGGVPVSALATGLSPGSAYRFRVVANNSEGEDEAAGAFSTFALPEPFPGCANDALRSGPSTALPDCRAYELVTPPDTSGHPPRGMRHLGVYFPASLTSPAGDALSFTIEGGLIPGSEGTGSYAGDPYLARRGEGGWRTANAGPNGTEAKTILPGSVSPDQGYSFWTAEAGGSAVLGGDTSYVHYPDGHSELIGRGSLGSDPLVQGKLISANGGHVIFVSPKGDGSEVRLEPDAPPEGTRAIYDRSGDEVTHVVSLLPGDVTPGAGKDASYVGASLNGRSVAFRIGSTLYLRYQDEATYEVGDGVTAAGFAKGGDRLFYLQGGDLFAFDAQAQEAIPFTSSGDVIPVNVSADGDAVYFTSPSLLGAGANPEGDLPQVGARNLYLSRGGSVEFIATLSDRDVKGEFLGQETQEGLGLWTSATDGGSSENPGRFGIDPSRSTADGRVLLFESRLDLTDRQSQGRAQVYRYDSVAGTLSCISCLPTGAPASANASLQLPSTNGDDVRPSDSFTLLANLSPDGNRAFFQSPDPLVLGDTDGLLDVYEWEEEDMGSCHTPGGCVYLISSGRSSHPDYLYAIGEGGEDVFFSTSDLLVPSLDGDETPSIYDARVGGGFPPPAGRAGECLGETCQPAAAASDYPTPASLSFEGAGNVVAEAATRCPKPKRKVRRGRHTRCVSSPGRRAKHGKQTNTKRRAAR